MLHDFFGGFKAYDLVCPVEMDGNITVTVNNQTFYAECPKCGTKYNIFTGMGFTDDLNNCLIPYRVAISNNMIIVSNY